LIALTCYQFFDPVRLVRAMFFEPGIYDSPSRVAALATSLIF
jgi:hypothetical protein